MENYDFIIIGGGRAASLASKIAKKNKKVALIEKALLGGTCANKGCVPSKLLIGYADVIRAIQESKKHFIESEINKINIEKIFENNNNFISRVDENYLSKLDENVKLFRAEASFVSNKIIEVDNQQITAATIIIATGTRPKKPPFENAWTSDDIFPLNKIPKSITIVGAGFIACEIANVFDALGVETKMIVRGDTLLSNEDEDISKTFKDEFSKNIDIKFNSTVKDAIYEENSFTITLKKDENELTSYKSEALLYAIGRESNADLLKLENTNIKLDKRGYIKRDKYFETDEKGIFVVGDATGKYMLQHAAAYEINHLYKYLLEDEKKPLEFKYMPHAVFTHPEIASVGLTEKQAKENKIDFVVSKTPWLASARAQSKKIKYPFTKFIVDKTNYKILGCHMIGPESSTMIHQVLTVMHINNDIRHLKEMLYIHPALSESLLPAAINTIKLIESK
eukprot:TRINITY_DN229_c0_g1_i5.p1 TRINITY_DN229_c0_g1~~TRINITY_DN229_c0_g1_i5.p1  ORF type:complete len:453 (-),score=59.91 TRINITY_DN229_c0_g1_i5:479-1837(-)